MSSTKINASEFASAARKYADQKAREVDGSNGKLSRLEATRLPADLQDNFRALANVTPGTISTRTFVNAFADHVEASVKQADTDNDGFLSAEEAATLPVDLQDNLFNYSRRIGGSGGRMTDAQLSSHIRDSVPVSDGPQDGVTRKVAVGDLSPEVRPEIEKALASMISDGDELTAEDFRANDVYVVFNSSADRTVAGFAVYRDAFNQDGGVGARQVLGFNMNGKQIHEDWEGIS